VLMNIDNGDTVKQVSEDVKAFMKNFPLYPEM